MQVGGDHPFDGFAVQMIIENSLPVFLHIFVEDAGIHYGPTIIVAQQPNVDVNEPTYHRHANPKNAVCDFC